MRVIITRPLEYSQEFIELLNQHGLDYFLLPCLEFAQPSDNYSSLDKVIRANHEYDWLIFLSKKAAQVFFERLLELGGHLFHLSPRLKIACIGESTANYVRDEIGFPVEFVPSQFNSKVFLQEFKPDSMSRLVLIRNEIVEDDFVDKLSSQVLQVDLALAYKTQCPQTSLVEFDNLLSSGEELILSFTSSETVCNFKALLGKERIENLRVSRVLSIGPRTTETIKQELPGFEIIEALAANRESMLNAIMVLDVQT